MSNGNEIVVKYSPMLRSRIEKIKSLDEFDKLDIYIDYYITQLGLRYSFEVVDLRKENALRGWSKPDKIIKQISFFFLWKNIKINSFGEFFSEQNIEIRDCGEDWKERGFAQRWWVECFGVYNWVLKFGSKFNI